MLNRFPAWWFGLVFALAVATQLSAAQRRQPVWLKVEAENFTVLSALDERATATWAAEFTHFVNLLKRFITLDSRRLPPITVILFARDRDFDAYRIVGLDGKPMSDLAGFFSRRETWAVAGLTGTRSNAATRRTIFHEGVHWFFSAFHQPNPPWIEEGVAEAFSTFTLNRKKMTWGQGIEEHVFALQMWEGIPVERLMYMDRGMLLHGGGLPGGLLYAQSWAFAHYLLFGKHSLPPDALNTYLRLYHSAIHPDEAFKQAFGMGHTEMQANLERYIHGGKYLVYDAPLPELPAPNVLPAETIEVEIGLARLAIASGRRALAREHASAAVESAPDDPRGYEMLGIVLDESGERPAAVSAYRSASERGSKDFRSAFQLGLAILENAGDRLTAEDARSATRYFQVSINLHPFQIPAYRNLARIASSLASPTVEDRKFLDLGLRLFPNDGMILLGLATLDYRTGDRSGALGVVHRILEQDAFHDRATRDLANSLDERWTHELAMEKVKEAHGARQYAEAARQLNELVRNSRLGSQRLAYARMQREYLARDVFEQAVAANEAGDRERAKTLAEEVIANDDAPAATKNNARRLLSFLERRRPAAKAP
jgi:hypothetical protein